MRSVLVAAGVLLLARASTSTSMFNERMYAEDYDDVTVVSPKSPDGINQYRWSQETMRYTVWNDGHPPDTGNFSASRWTRKEGVKLDIACDINDQLNIKDNKEYHHIEPRGTEMAVASLVSTALPTFRHTHLIFQYLCGQATPLQQTPELTVLAHYRNSSEVLFTATCASDWNRKLNTSCIKQLKLSYPNSWWSKAKILLPFTRDKYSLEILGFQPSNGFVMVDNLGLHTNAICRPKKIPFFRFRRRRDEYLGDEVASQLPMYSACLKDLLGSSSGAPTCNMIHRDDGKYQVVADGSYTERWQKLSHLAYFSFSQRQVIYALKCDDYGGSLPLSPGYYGSQDFFLWENLPNTTTFPDGEKEVLTPRWVTYTNSWAPSAIAELQDNCLKTMIRRKVWNLTADAAAYMNTINPRGFMSVITANDSRMTLSSLISLKCWSCVSFCFTCVDHLLTPVGVVATINSPLDLWQDKPYYLGCYEGVESKKRLAGKGSSAYLCAAECEATNDIFQAVGVDGEACVCLEQVNFSDIRKRDCTTRCPQEPEQLCGDGDSVLALYAYDSMTHDNREIASEAKVSTE
ncbi:uncharacterized protein [Panulirus ornatus]|uniref:uncharacterized protein n=1 Tax=Panulirus ornatus TaxID=150431 RepID=UPI003A8A7E8F